MNIPFSLEFFPPKTDAGAEKLVQVHAELATFNPEFCSITYGAGGSTRERTLSSVDALHNKFGIAVAPHLSCIGDDPNTIKELLHRYQAQGIQRIVALRGDLPSGQYSLGELPYAKNLVEFIRQETGDHFHIEVAAYPEMHPAALGFEQDLKHFANKVQAGANSAITQFFYNPDSYAYFVERVRALGLDIPIVPGIMPITNASNLLRFADNSGADIPRYIRKALADFGDDTARIKEFGHAVVVKLCKRLIELGAPSLHFYTMNQSESVSALLRDV